jgi:hypothetical protein
MFIELYCEHHDNAPVVPAGDNLHFIERAEGSYELDEGDLYCTGGHGDHVFKARINISLP